MAGECGRLMLQTERKLKEEEELISLGLKSIRSKQN
jgi:aryl carrier-like protein